MLQKKVQNDDLSLSLINLFRILNGLIAAEDPLLDLSPDILMIIKN